MNSPELEQRVRELVEQAQKKENGALKLSNIARQCNVPYNRLYRFMQIQDPLWSGDAQRIYETLSGKPLLPTTDV